MVRRSMILMSEVLVAAFALGAAGAAYAQSASTGALTGRVTDASSNLPVAGVTVVAQGPQGEQAELTDAEGSYTITGLLPGQYVIRFYYANVKVERQNVTVFADKKIQVNVPMQTKAASAETYTITEKAPTVDVGSTKVGTTVTKDFVNNVPTGASRNLRFFAGCLGVGGGSGIATFPFSDRCGSGKTGGAGKSAA